MVNGVLNILLDYSKELLWRNTKTTLKCVKPMFPTLLLIQAAISERRYKIIRSI